MSLVLVASCPRQKARPTRSSRRRHLLHHRPWPSRSSYCLVMPVAFLPCPAPPRRPRQRLPPASRRLFATAHVAPTIPPPGCPRENGQPGPTTKPRNNTLHGFSIPRRDFVKQRKHRQSPRAGKHHYFTVCRLKGATERMHRILTPSRVSRRNDTRESVDSFRGRADARNTPTSAVHTACCRTPAYRDTAPPRARTRELARQRVKGHSFPRRGQSRLPSDHCPTAGSGRITTPGRQKKTVRFASDAITNPIAPDSPPSPPQTDKHRAAPVTPRRVASPQTHLSPVELPDTLLQQRPLHAPVPSEVRLRHPQHRVVPYPPPAAHASSKTRAHQIQADALPPRQAAAAGRPRMPVPVAPVAPPFRRRGF